MENVQVEVVNGVFHLLDDKGAIVFFDEDWKEVTAFAYGDYNIQYQPKDLIFDVCAESEEGPYVYFDLKYASSDGNLDGNNVINLPAVIYGCLMECHFSYDEKVSKKKVIAELVAAGATYQELL